MTTAEAATKLGVSRSRVLKMIADGRLKARKTGRDWHILPGSLPAVRERPAGYPKGRPRKG